MEHALHFSHSPISHYHALEKSIAVKNICIPLHKHRIPTKYRTIKLLDYINNDQKALNKSLNIIVQRINSKCIETTDDVLHIKPYSRIAKPLSISANKTPSHEGRKNIALFHTHCEETACFTCEKCDRRYEKRNRNKSSNILSSTSKNSSLLQNLMFPHPYTDKLQSESIRKSRLLQPLFWKGKDCTENLSVGKFTEGSKHKYKIQISLKKPMTKYHKHDDIGRWDMDLDNNQFTSGALDIQ